MIRHIYFTRIFKLFFSLLSHVVKITYLFSEASLQSISSYGNCSNTWRKGRAEVARSAGLQAAYELCWELNSLEEITELCPKGYRVSKSVYASFLIHLHNKLFLFHMSVFESVSNLYLHTGARQWCIKSSSWTKHKNMLKWSREILLCQSHR